MGAVGVVGDDDLDVPGWCSVCREFGFLIGDGVDAELVAGF